MSTVSMGFGKYAFNKRCWIMATDFGVTGYVRIGKKGHIFGYSSEQKALYRYSINVT